MSKTLANELAAGPHPRQPSDARDASTPIASASSTRSAARRRARRPTPVEEDYSKTIPLGRYGAANEYGDAAVFLFSDAARYITGASLQVDGGMIKAVY